MKQRPGHYGAWELKTGYRRTAVLGFICALVIHAAAVALIRYLPPGSQPDPPERLLRAVRSVPRLMPPGGLPTPGGEATGTSGAYSSVGGPSDIPRLAPDADVDPVFALHHTPMEVLPHIDGADDLLGGTLLVGKVPFRTAHHEFTRATVYGELDAAGVDIPPRIVEKIKPEYPAEGLAYLFDADVVIRILIGAEGHVDQAFVVAESGVDMGFEESALAAVRKWLFYPALKDGQSVAMWLDVPIAYRLVVFYDMSDEARKNLRTRVIF